MPEPNKRTANVIFELTGAQISNDLQQTMPVTPGCAYRFQFRARGAQDGGGLIAELTYLNAGGGSLATYTAGGNSGTIDPDAWISYYIVTSPSPPTATQVRLRFSVQGRTKAIQLADVVLAVEEQAGA